MHVELHHSVAKLERLARLERQASMRDRMRAVVAAMGGQTAADIAERLGYHSRWVFKWVSRYNADGLEALRDRPRPGQPPKLAQEQEEAFKARVDAGPTPQDGVCVFHGEDVRSVLSKEFGADYSLGGVYYLLHRLGYSRLCPRPRHRKNDPDAMAQWKSDAPPLCNKSSDPIPIGKFKSGSKTKPASVNKVR